MFEEHFSDAAEKGIVSMLLYDFMWDYCSFVYDNLLYSGT